MKVAIVHEMLVKLGGAEKVVQNFMEIFPDAPIFTLIYDEKKCGKDFPKEKIHPQVFASKTQKIYNLTGKQRFCLPYMARAIEEFDFSEFDLVLCSSSGFAHGAITKPATKFIVYSHSPARYLWDWTNEYKRDLGIFHGMKKLILKNFIEKTLHKNRLWDYAASARADKIIANSDNVKKRIAKYYRRESEVLYPPVETDRFGKKIAKNYKKPFEKYYIIISALTEFKKIEVAIAGFNELSANLLIIGAGDYRAKLEEKVTGENIIFTGPKYGDELVDLVQNSLGLIFAGEDDFGIVPVEVMAAGKPVFALSEGGLLETNIDGVTGGFFSDRNGADFVENFKKFHKKNMAGEFRPENCKNNAQKFSKEFFQKTLRAIIDAEMAKK